MYFVCGGGRAGGGTVCYANMQSGVRMKGDTLEHDTYYFVKICTFITRKIGHFCQENVNKDLQPSEEYN